MNDEHENLVKSMLHFLSHSLEAEIWVIAGFHTGRATLAAFFDTAVSMGLDISQIYERDVDGRERAWKRERDSGLEDVTERKRWLVVAVLDGKPSEPPGPLSLYDGWDSTATLGLASEKTSSSTTLLP